MKGHQVLFFVAILVCIVISNASAQNNFPKTQINCEKDSRRPECLPWKPMKLWNIEFSVPQAFEFENSKCMEGRCVSAIYRDVSLRLNCNVDAWRPIIERGRALDYAENVKDVSGARIWSWHYRELKEPTFRSGAILWDESRKNYVCGLYFRFNSLDDMPMIDRIIDSFGYPPKVTTELNTLTKHEALTTSF